MYIFFTLFFTIWSLVIDKSSSLPVRKFFLLLQRSDQKLLPLFRFKFYGNSLQNIHCKVSNRALEGDKNRKLYVKDDIHSSSIYISSFVQQGSNNKSSIRFIYYTIHNKILLDWWWSWACMYSLPLLPSIYH